MASSSPIKLLKELDLRKISVNIQNIDNNKYFKWYLVSYLHPADHNLKITKADTDFAERRDFKDIRFPVKTRDIYKTQKKEKIASALVLLVMKIRKNIQTMYKKML